jgi:hypothetical protein
MACKALTIISAELLSLSVLQIPMGILSGGDAEALFPNESSAAFKPTI